MEITTNTIAELYIKQGYPEKAIDIYNAILEIDPGNVTAIDHLRNLQAEIQGETSEAVSLEESHAVAAATVAEVVSATMPESMGLTASSVATAANSGEPLPNDAGSQIARLESWLENIQLLKGNA